MISDPELSIAAIREQVAGVGDHLQQNLAEEKRYCRKLSRLEAERERSRTRRLVSQLLGNTPEGRMAAAKARARAVHAQIDEIAAEGDLKAIQAQAPGDPALRLGDVRIDDLQSLFSLRADLPDWLRERIETISKALGTC